MSNAPLQRLTELPYQKLNEEVLVVDPKTRQVHLLNPTASRVWELLATPHTLEELVSDLGAEFEAGEDGAEILRTDVRGLLADLGQKGLLEGEGWRELAA